MFGCVPNDCVADCNSWFGLSIPLLKTPFCPCVPVTCTKGEENEKKKGGKKCKALGCGKLPPCSNMNQCTDQD